MVDRYLSKLDAELPAAGEPDDGDADRGPAGPPQHVGPGVAA
jgi:hypothetical protein